MSFEDSSRYIDTMTPLLEEAIERLREMSPERQDAFARLLNREFLADEQWMRSTAQNAEWWEQRRVSGAAPTTSGY